MTASFAESARKLAGATSRLLGWPPAWFWSATPAELSAIFADENTGSTAGVSRSEIQTMIERDKDGR